MKKLQIIEIMIIFALVITFKINDMRNIEKRKLIVKTNNSQRTATLRFYYQDGTIVKYRTLPFSSEEFESVKRRTDEDWIQFLKTDEYYIVK